MTNIEIAQLISERIGQSPVPHNDIRNISYEIYQELGGESELEDFEDIYELLLTILPMAQIIDDTSIRTDKTWSSYKISTELTNAGFDVEIVTELPSVGDPHTIYFILKQDSSTGDVYDEWMYIDGNWEMVGNTQIDLNGYAKISDVDASLAMKADRSELNNYVLNTSLADYATLNDISTFITLDDTSMYATIEYVDASLVNKADVSYVDSSLALKQNVISDLSTIRSGAALGSTALQSVPSEYITESELDASLASYATNASLATKQDVLTAGTNIEISGTTISATYDVASTAEIEALFA